MTPRSGVGLPSIKRTTGIEPATLSLGSWTSTRADTSHRSQAVVLSGFPAIGASRQE